MERDLIDQFNKINAWHVRLNSKIISPPKGKDLHIRLVDGIKVQVNTLHFRSDPYAICFIASDYFYDVNNISQEEVILFLIEKDEWFRSVGENCKEINTNLKLTYPTNIVNLMNEVIGGIEESGITMLA